jgi:putative inorganic carbon (hco3(-)) transporter
MSVVSPPRTLMPRPAAMPAPVSAASCAAPPGYALGYLLFLLLNAILFIRPNEFVPGLIGFELYQTCIILCLLVSFPVMLFQLAPRELASRPITVCVLGFALAVTMTNLVHASQVDFLDATAEVYKLVLYYLLFISLVTTPQRLRRFLFWLPVFVAVIAELTLLQYHGWIELPILNPLREGIQRSRFDDEGIVVRLMGTGIFRDPNDMCVLLAFTIPLCLYWLLTDTHSGRLRFVWLLPLALIGTAMVRTQSRGGFLALLVGIVVLLRARFGWMRTIALGMVVIPALFLLVGGRQTRIGTDEQTGQSRVQLWSDGLLMLRQAPLFGVGKDRYAEEAGQVAHNSFVHAFAELGPVGGVLFLGAFYLAFRALWQLGSPRREQLGSELAQMQPFLTGAVATYITGMMTLSLTYVTPTFTVLALAVTFERLAVARGVLSPTRTDHWLLMRLLGIGLCFLIFIYVFIRLVLLRG